ncbi:synaptic vesicle transporter SVOP [Aspergillus oryzae 100-8]|uniref:Synaptic vesicle transporter SVOP n=1 Tax=Aspergillus oryzae (strain 3.042) TaxID=1160506 RepID=I8A4V5_ASPO3|nr:synaptic vesicle transporter SVOP [Aspergillus oryzae 3.042]KDE75317.1 synaptic vesicle transporter SVOP [Aspergillus oryzae 100-8]|eukprot:EIT80022.1 synaptic vesicle transporter SVOP [Aspergillus oryzae 3.042]
MTNNASSSEKHPETAGPANIVPLIPPTDANLVTLDGLDDPHNPKNWSARKKWLAFVPMSMFNLLSSMYSATVAPALLAIGEDLGFPSNTLLILSLSVFFLGTAIVPLFTAPVSEMIGRVPVLLTMNVVYIVFNTACGAAKSPTQLIIFRFLAGLGAAGPYGVTHDRGEAIAVFTLAPLIGTAIGPITGGFVVQYVSWRWCFYVISIAIVTIQIIGLILIRETYGPVLLKRKAARLRKSTQNPDLHTEHDRTSTHLNTNLIRPFCLLTTQPITQVLSPYLAYLNGLLYLMVVTFHDVWAGIYQESVSIGSLNYLSMTVGLAIAAQFGVRFADKIYQRLRAKNNGQEKPEFRLPMLCAIAVVVPIGLFWYGWRARTSIHWIMPDIGAAIYSGATVLQLVCVQGYLIDTYQVYAASAMASVMVLRNLLGFGLPLLAPSLYGNLGFAWGNTLGWGNYAQS